MQQKRRSLFSLLLAGSVFLSACDSEKFWTQLKSEWSAFLVVMQGGQSPLATSASPRPDLSAIPAPSGSPDLAELSRVNAEFLQEVYRVVFVQDPASRVEFGSLVDSLNQGAPLEGIYNGFAHSAEYRSLEKQYPGASAAALKAFAVELAELEAELAEPTRFDERSAQPLALPVTPSADGSAPVSEVAFAPSPSASPAPVDKDTLSAQYVKTFLGASIYTLKRVLGDEALKVVSSKQEYREKLALWYSHWAVRMSAYPVDFGLELRKKTDQAFHYRWALAAGQDRMQWEVLNRLHRILNDANRNKQ